MGRGETGHRRSVRPLLRRCPDAVPVKIRGVVGSSYQAIKNKFQGLGGDIAATDVSELTYAIAKALLK